MTSSYFDEASGASAASIQTTVPKEEAARIQRAARTMKAHSSGLSRP